MPYRDGTWRFLPPWGWTWIDTAPWGFAPSHYGRWAHLDDRWGWVPGPRLAAADYSPAVVAFLGTAGIGLSRPGDIGATPAVAWFPLAPGETIGDGQEANYRNRLFATAVSRPAFAGGLAVAASVVDDVPERRFADAPVILDAIGIAPVGAAITAPKKPAAVTVAAVTTPESPTIAPSPAPVEATRQPFIVALRDTPVRALVQEVRRRVGVAIVLRSRPPPSTSALRSPHNRQHLAAARGGV